MHGGETLEQKALLARLEEFVGVQIGEPTRARDPVNQPMIRHWCDAIDDRNPAYTDPEFAARSIHGGVVAPPTMLQAWTMPGLASRAAGRAVPAALRGILGVLDEAGFTSVIATNCTQEYRRYLKLGDHLTMTQTIESVSPEKQTALGPGHFVTQLVTYRDQHGEVVATMRFRLLKFRPSEKKSPQPAGERPAAGEARRPLPAITRDNRFFWEGIDAGRLLIQCCSSCGKLRHPPGPMCPACRSLEWHPIESSGRGTVYSYAVTHHPPIPPFEVPNVIVLVELEEGTRIVSNLLDVEPGEVHVGMAVKAEFPKIEGDRRLLQFRRAVHG